MFTFRDINGGNNPRAVGATYCEIAFGELKPEIIYSISTRSVLL